MTISVADTALEKETRAMRSCAWRSPLRSWLAWIYCGVFLASFAGFYVFWYTNTYYKYVLSHTILRNGTQVFDWWQDTPFNLTDKIYVFNYTNVDDFEAGRASKLHVQEIGPYTYSEKSARVNVMIHPNGTVTFQRRKIYHWIGGRSEDDVVVVPNVPLMFATALVRDLNIAMRFSLTTLLSTLHEGPFINVTAGGYLWGYDNPLFEMAKPFMMLQRELPFEKFGVMAMNNGTGKDRITMYTGEQDINKIGLIERVNGKENRNVWDNERCDKIGGSDGSIFPYYLIENRSNILEVFSKELCRNIPFSFTEEVTTFGMPSLRYTLLTDAFSPSNDCFCPKVKGKRETCPPVGFFNISACNDNSPLLSSFPHFYGGDESLLETIDGLNPRQKDHESYIDIHAFFRKPIAGWSRVQINLEVRKAIGVPFLGKLKDGTILPLFWFEVGIDELPEMVLSTLNKNCFIAQTVEMALQWFTLISMVISLSALITCFWKYRGEQHKPFQKNVSGSKHFLATA